MILNLELDFNPETETVKVKSCKVVKETITSVREEESSEPQLVLDNSKYTLNSAAIELMKLKVDDRIDIKYQVINGIEYPVIGTEAGFGSGGGNKLTKSNTVSYRGKANERLASFGNLFTIAPMKGYEDLFILISGHETELEDNSEVSEDIEVVEDMTNHEDIPQESLDLDEPLVFEDDEPEEEDLLIEEDSLNFN